MPTAPDCLELLAEVRPDRVGATSFAGAYPVASPTGQATPVPPSPQ